jgi:aminodeoxyfutalosine deaminase
MNDTPNSRETALAEPNAARRLPSHLAALPKTELHLHLEGSIQPSTVCALTAQHDIELTEEEVRRRYCYTDFLGFIDAFKWVTSFLREPRDYALVAGDLAEYLLTQKVVYAEITLSVGIMLLRKQRPEDNFEAILEATEPFEKRGLQLNWIFDAVRQFGADAAMQVVESARRSASQKIVAFGIGGDELSVATKEFQPVYKRAAANGLHLLMHAGEIGGPEKIREAVELLHVERIGHGIAAFRDPALMDLLADRRIALEICPQSNICTGALEAQLRAHRAGNAINLSADAGAATNEQHPLPQLLRHGIPIVLSTDDPAMFHTTLLEEYENAARMGLSESELLQLTRMGFDHAFRPARNAILGA